MNLRSIIAILITVVASILPQKTHAIDNDLVVAQMNSCVNTLTNIINNKSMSVLDHETDQLLNNLTMQHIVGLPEIAEFRVDLIDAIGALGITEEERSLLRRINSIKQDNLKWQALSGALSNTMLVTGGGNTGLQLGFQSLLTAARTAVEYKTTSNNLQIEELQAMWELRKEDLKTFVNLRKEALGIIFSLYQKYNLKESDRLTEQSSQQFQKIISEPDAQRMIRLLIDNASKFSHIADYYYYLGMGYLDIGNFEKANEYFSMYETTYQKAPIYRIDEKSGLIALARLAYFSELNSNEIKNNIELVLKNLPSNSMAIIQCAIAYNKLLHNPEKALDILRSALDNDDALDKTAIVLAASAIIPDLKKDIPEYTSFIAAYNNQEVLDLDAVLNILLAQNGDVWNFLKTTFELKGLASRPWYRSKWTFGVGFFCDQSVNVGKKIVFSYPLKYSVDLHHVKMWVEKHEDNQIKLNQYTLSKKANVSIEDIEDIDCFKNNPNLKFLYMESADVDGEFRIKANIDYAAIEREDYPRQSEFTLSEKDIKNIVKFLKKHENKSSESEIVATRENGSKIETEHNGVKFIVIGDSINVKAISNNELQEGITYVKFFFDDTRNIELCYKYDNKNECLIPCFITYNGERHFVNDEYLIEFGIKAAPSKEVKAPWYSKVWKSLCDWFRGIWDSVCNWF